MDFMRSVFLRPLAVIIMAAFIVGSFLSSAQASVNCATKDMRGYWMFSEQGTHLDWPPGSGGSAPFSEVGWVQLDRNGTGSGETFLSVGGLPIPNPNNINDATFQTNNGIPLLVTEIHVDSTCAGRATFIIPGDEDHPRTLRFILDKRGKEFRYISTTGDITVLGNAKRIR